jgi:hypothetical protein
MKMYGMKALANSPGNGWDKGAFLPCIWGILKGPISFCMQVNRYLLFTTAGNAYLLVLNVKRSVRSLDST